MEIGQDKLKTQLVSCISDLEKDRDFVDFNKENKPINLASPPQTFSPTPAFSPAPKQDTFSPGPQQKQDMFSPPPLEKIEPARMEPAPFAMEAAPFSMEPALAAPVRNGVKDTNGHGFSEFLGSQSKVEVQQSSQFESSSSFQQSSSLTSSSSSQQQQFEISSANHSLAGVMNSGLNGGFEESGSVQGSSSSSSLLQKIMTPAQPEYDTGSLKRRDPRKMFTDSSFYSAKHHPTVADQVELAHKLSSAMFNEKNKSTKGQQMFLSRVENAGEDEVDQQQGKMPSLKHVMNPEGRMTEWEDVSKEDQPNMEQMMVHAAPNLNTPDPIAESLNAEAGKGGELFAKRRKRAENWVVDDASIGNAKPSAFADKFMQEQTERQTQFAQEQHAVRQQKEDVQQQKLIIQQTESSQQQSLAKQEFSEQQRIKQQHSDEIRRQTAEAQLRMEGSIDFPDNFKHTSLKARSNTPTLDLSCHNVQGINVWANTVQIGRASCRERV